MYPYYYWIFFNQINITQVGIYSSLDGHLIVSSYWLLWIKLLWACMYKFIGYMFSCTLGKYKEVELLGFRVGIHLTLLGSTNLFSKWLHHFKIPLEKWELTCFPSSPTFGIVSFLYFSNSSVSVAPLSDFKFHFPDDS